MRLFIIALLLFLIGNTTSVQSQPWIQITQDIDGEAAGDLSGVSVSLSADGNTLAIGASVNNDNRGHVRLFYWDSNISDWTQKGQDIDGEAQGDQFGGAVSLSADGNRIAIGAAGNAGNGNNAGHVRIFDWNGAEWIQTGQDIDGQSVGDLCGYSVSLSSIGNRVAIGSESNSNNGNGAGQVRIFDWNGLDWVQIGQDINGEAAEDQSGRSVSLSSDGTRVAIGARTNDGNGINAGQVRVFEWNANNWNQIGQDIDGEAAYDLSGSSVSLSANGNRVAIGAPQNEGNGPFAGHVRIYDWNGVAWIQAGQDINAELSADFFGQSVSISSDGNLVAIGAPYNDGDGVPQVNYGHARVFSWNGSDWIQKGQDIDGENEGDTFGFSVSLSSDGKRLVCGAPYNGGSGINAGHVRVYQSGGVLISGKVYQDYDLDHEFDTGETLLDGQIIQLSANDGSTKFRTTTVNGEYYFAVEDSGTYVVSYNPPSNFIETGGITSVILQGLNDTVVSDVNFGVGYLDTIVDIQANLTVFSDISSSSTFNAWTSSINVGNVTTNYSTVLSTDVLTSVTGFNQAEAVLQPGQVLTDGITLSHVTNNSTATITTDVVSSTNLGTEISINDNRDSVEVYIAIPPVPACCPYDPNDKTVFGANCEANYVEIGDTLEYRIRFMNTGTAPANTVVLIDTLDASVLDLRTFRVMGHSHPMNWDISGPGKLTITYPDINLPDSSVSFLGSQGFFKFRIVMRDTVSNLTQSGSSAFIYFDNEVPIETNEPTIIAVDSIPVSELTATDAICGGESGLIDASISFGIGADSAYWSNGSTGLPLPYNDEGTYTVELVDEYGCRYLDSIAVSCNILTSIDENGETFSVYPNPSNGKYYVNAKGNIRVFDVSGKEVYRASSFNATTEIDLSDLPFGVYTIQLTNKDGVFVGKVVRE